MEKTFTYEKIPQNVEELKALSNLHDEYEVASLVVLVLAAYEHNVEVARMSNSLIVCNFSNAFEPHKDKLKKFFNMKRSEFDEDEAHHEAVVNLIPLLSSYASDGQYLELLKNLQ